MSVYEILNGNEVFEGELSAFPKTIQALEQSWFWEHKDSRFLEYGVEEVRV